MISLTNNICYPDSMDLELPRTFLEVNRTRHFGQAADALCVTQAAVSARTKQLEGLLGVSLFDSLPWVGVFDCGMSCWVNGC